MTAACSFEPRVIQIVDGSANAGGQGGSAVRDASQESSDARAGSNGGGNGGAGGRNDASVDSAGTGGFSGMGGSGGASGTSGSGGSAAATGSGGAAGAGASGGTGGAAGVAGLGGGGAAGIAGSGGAAGIAGAGGTAGIAGTGGAGTTGGAGSGTGGNTGGSSGSDAGTTDGAAGQSGMDASDARLVDAPRVDAPAGSTVDLFVENFDSSLGAFTAGNGCAAEPQWKHRIDMSADMDNYAHVEEPEDLGVSSIVSTPIRIPANVSNIRLRLRHQVVTQSGHDGAQVLVSKNGGAPVVVTTFMNDGYVNGTIVNPDNCVAASQPGAYPAWSGNLQLAQPEADLSGPPLDVGPGDTVSIHLRIANDSSVAGGGWDVYWVRLTGTAQ